LIGVERMAVAKRPIRPTRRKGKVDIWVDRNIARLRRSALGNWGSMRNVRVVSQHKGERGFNTSTLKHELSDLIDAQSNDKIVLFTTIRVMERVCLIEFPRLRVVWIEEIGAMSHARRRGLGTVSVKRMHQPVTVGLQTLTMGVTERTKLTHDRVDVTAGIKNDVNVQQSKFMLDEFVGGFGVDKWDKVEGNVQLEKLDFELEIILTESDRVSSADSAEEIRIDRAGGLAIKHEGECLKVNPEIRNRTGLEINVAIHRMHEGIAMFIEKSEVTAVLENGHGRAMIVLPTGAERAEAVQREVGDMDKFFVIKTTGVVICVSDKRVQRLPQIRMGKNTEFHKLALGENIELVIKCVVGVEDAMTHIGKKDGTS
jgi:hypothetical protein